MPLSAGTRIGSYDIVSLVGAGGMGEVYRARDRTLQRDVALKVLPEHLAADADRVSRFGREAQALAALNHPAVAAIYGFEDGRALVMEFVDGPTLDERIMSGPMPIGEAVAIAIQIVDGLEAAHERGIVHRDLKPANIKVRPDGTVKILDFGLAKIIDAGGSPPIASAGAGPSTLIDVTKSPTLAVTLTRATIIGTAPYMAPEQARGKTIDRRVDVWAFGCVLFEMLTGTRTFPGDDPTDVLARVIERDPDWSALPPATPTHIRHLLARTLDKDPKTRLRDIGEARVALSRQASNETALQYTPGLVTRRTRWRTWVAAGLAVALVLSLATLWRATRISAVPIDRFDIVAPADTLLSLIGQPLVTIAPDGRTIAFVATRDGISRLYVRRRGDAESRAIAATEGASTPAFSPNGQWLAFVSGTELKKTTLDGPPITLAKVTDHRGVAWIDDQTIVFAPYAAGPLFTISASGGSPMALSTLQTKKGERTHRWPTVVPGGGTVLFTIGTYGSPDSYENSRIDALNVATGERRTVFEGASFVRVVRDRLLFSRGGLVYSVPFDYASLTTTGSPSILLRDVGGDVTTGAVHFAVADDGTLVYVTDSNLGGARRMMTWVDPSGTTEALSLPQDVYNDPRLSPDGSRMAVIVGASGSGDVWVHDLKRNTFTRMTFDGANASPAWSKDGQYIYFASPDASGLKTTIKKRRSDGSRESETVATVDSRVYLRDLTADESGIYLDDFKEDLTPGGRRAEVTLLTFATPPAKQVVVSTPGDDFETSLSPNGRWLAYSSDESGRKEVYVRDVASAGGRWQVSSTGGQEPKWSPDSRTIYFRFGNRFFAANVTSTEAFSVDTPRALFSGVYDLQSATNRTYDIDLSGRRFLMIRPAGDPNTTPPRALRVVLNALN